MTLSLDEKLITNFRNKVNENPIFRSIYRNINKKNKWNIICSAMDWINVTAEGLPKINLNYRNGFGVNHLESLNLMQYIVSIDILVEAIIQLYRVLDNSNNYPLSNDNSIFKQSKLSDDKYFKHVRAVFGTHPVNLDSLDGESKQEGERFYASWSVKGILDEFDYTVYLYSNNPSKDNLYNFGIRMDQINEYAEKRYSLLNDLTKKVDDFLSNHKDQYVGLQIKKINDPVQQLLVLVDENNIRYGEGYGFDFEISYLLRMLSTDILDEDELINSVVQEYKNYLIKQVSIIKSGLETLDNDVSFHWTWFAKGYEFEKIYTYLEDLSHPLGRLYLDELVILGVLPNMITDSNKTQLILDSIVYALAKIKGNSIDFNELKNSKFCK